MGVLPHGSCCPVKKIIKEVQLAFLTCGGLNSELFLVDISSVGGNQRVKEGRSTGGGRREGGIRDVQRGREKWEKFCNIGTIFRNK